MTELTIEKLRACAKEFLDYDPVAEAKERLKLIEFFGRSREEHLKIAHEIDLINRAQEIINNTFRIK